MTDCRSCKHNTYSGNASIEGWVDCSHPVTIAKSPRPEAGDPAWVNFMTADRPIPEMVSLMNGATCAAWEKANQPITVAPRGSEAGGRIV